MIRWIMILFVIYLAFTIFVLLTADGDNVSIAISNIIVSSVEEGDDPEDAILEVATMASLGKYAFIPIIHVIVAVIIIGCFILVATMSKEEIASVIEESSRIIAETISGGVDTLIYKVTESFIERVYESGEDLEIYELKRDVGEAVKGMEGYRLEDADNDNMAILIPYMYILEVTEEDVVHKRTVKNDEISDVQSFR